MMSEIVDTYDNEADAAFGGVMSYVTDWAKSDERRQTRVMAVLFDIVNGGAEAEPAPHAV